MPRTRPLGPPPDERPNWDRLNEGQRRYAWEQYKLAKVRRGIPIDHPIPGGDQPQEEEANQPEDDPDPLAILNEGEQGPEDWVPDEEDIQEVEQYDVPDHLPMSTPMQVDQVGSSGGNKRPVAGQSGINKKQKTGGTTLPGTAGGIGGAGGGMEGTVEQIPRPIYNSQTQIRHYRKVHRILTFGLAYKPVAVARTGPPAYSDVFMVTSLAHIPWEYPFMYLNPSEFSLLPPGARVKHVSCKVKAENVRIAFPTNASESNLATLNQNKFLRVGVGLNQKIQCINATPGGFSAAQPMIATSVTPFPANGYQNWVDNFYGVANDDTTAPDVFTTQTPRHQFGIPWVAQYYCCPVTQTNDPLKSGWEDFQSKLSEIKVDGPSGYIAEVDYSPAIGLLKAPIQSIWTGVPSTATPATARNVPVNTGAGNTQARRIDTIIQNGQAVGVTEVESNFVRQPLSTNFTLIQPIEKNQRICSGITPEYFAQSQPTLHVGVMPVPALTTAAINNDTNNSSFTDSQAYFEITCEMQVECAFPTLRPLATVANTSMGNLLYEKSGNADLSYSSSMMYGLFQTS